ncbi:MAG: methyl-accepting chemotaxis protein [Bacteroidota bacterium]
MNISIRAHAILLLLVATGSYFLVTTLYVGRQKRAVLETAKSTMVYTKDYLSFLGTLSLRRDSLFAGETKINGSVAFVDEMLEKTGYGCTIFQGNFRVSTTAVAANAQGRAIGTTANAEITQKVFEQGETFVGVTKTIGKEWIIIYEPLANSDGQIIGMIALFKEMAEFNDWMRSFRLLVAGILLFITVLVFLLIRATLGAYKRLQKSQQSFEEELGRVSAFSFEIAKGNLDTKFEASESNEQLANALLSMQTNLKSTIEEIQLIVNKAGRDGLLDVRMDVNDKLGAWNQLAVEVNHLISEMARPVQEVTLIAKVISSGDLTPLYSGAASGQVAELADHLNIALQNINSLLHQVEKHSSEVGSASEAMGVTIRAMRDQVQEARDLVLQVAEGANVQLDKVDKTSDLLLSVLRHAKESAQQAAMIQNEAQEGSDRSDHGLEVIETLEADITELANFSVRSNAAMDRLGERSAEINKVLSVVNDIAAKTHLLALNAAIEAAKAGESGRGFAIVAEEIRSLADESKTSIHQIEGLVTGVQSESLNATKLTKELDLLVQKGKAATSQVSGTFGEIRAFSARTLSSSEGITEKSKQQIMQLEHVTELMGSIVKIADETVNKTKITTKSMDNLTEDMSTTTEQSQQLVKVAHELSRALQRFQLSRVDPTVKVDDSQQP